MQLGFSTLVCLMNNGRCGSHRERRAAAVGAFSGRANAPLTEKRAASIVRSPDAGSRVVCELRSRRRRPALRSANVAVDVWQSSPVGLYENQDETQV